MLARRISQVKRTAGAAQGTGAERAPAQETQLPPRNPMSATDASLLTTPLNALHIELGARMVPFALSLIHI